MEISNICPLCGFERRDGDAHMVWFDPMPNRIDLPTWGCGICVTVQHPQRLGIITADNDTPCTKKADGDF